MKIHDLVTLPVRSVVLLLLWTMAYYYGYGTPHKESREESPEMGVVVRYTRNGRPWRTVCDRDKDSKWDVWIDERAGRPFIVSIDTNGDGKPDRDEDEWGRTLSGAQAAKLRTSKTLVEFLHNPRQLAYTGLAIVVYCLLELFVRLSIHSRHAEVSR
jgi:hypothetical protein